MDEPIRGDDSPDKATTAGDTETNHHASHGEVGKDDRMWAVAAHLSGLLAAALSGGILVFLGPLIIWLIKKDESPFVDDQGKEALNFQLTILIIYAILWAMIVFTCFVLLPVVAPCILLPFILQVVLGIIAAIKASNGEYYRYPINIRFIK